MQELLQNVTREVAVALASAQVRAAVYDALQRSPYREHKLHFATFLRTDASPLLAGMAAARQRDLELRAEPGKEVTNEAVLATLDSIADVEFYMPVPEHFATWRGGTDLLVAGRLRDNGSAPYGFDLAGNAVALTAEAPPATPTLVIVPVETNFSVVPAQQGAEPQANASMFGEGVYMTRAVMYADHEGWPNGNPEFEVHVFQTDVNDVFRDVHCSGQQQVTPYQWNTEETTNWTGEVLLATDGLLAQGELNQFQMWEEDSGPCTDPSGGRPPDIRDLTWQQYLSWQSNILNVIAIGIPATVGEIIAILNAVPASYTFLGFIKDDDEVGVLKLQGNCWPEGTGPVMHRIVSSDPGHPETGWATLEYRFNFTRDPICQGPGPSVTISGPVLVEATGTYEWIGEIGNASPPYTYQWYANGTPVGNSATLSLYVDGSGDISLELETNYGYAPPFLVTWGGDPPCCDDLRAPAPKKRP